MKCPKCGMEKREGDNFCIGCGNQYPKEENYEQIKIGSLLKLVFKIILWVIVIFIVVFVLGFVIMWPKIKKEINSQWNDKPIIYIYPEKEEEVTIIVDHPEYFTVTYPKYNNGWKVTAKKDGTLIDENERSYYALYWEGKQNKKNDIKEDGFIIKGEDTISFLEEKLKVLGLNDKEMNEFIIYWLPQLEKNNYNYIRFETMEEINHTMALTITPPPDTLIRVMMEYKPLKKKVKVKAQKLTEVERKGYTVVEWGGTLIN